MHSLLERYWPICERSKLNKLYLLIMVLFEIHIIGFDKFTRIFFWSPSLYIQWVASLSSIYPRQEQITHPFDGKGFLRSLWGTWQRQLLPVFEKAFMHFLQQPFIRLSSILYSFGLRVWSLSSSVQPWQPQERHPSDPRRILRWVAGTTQTQVRPPWSLFLQLVQQFSFFLGERERLR